MKFLKNTFSNKAACSPTPTLSLPYPPSLSPFLTLPPYLPSLPSLPISLSPPLPISLSYPPSLSPFLTLPPYLPSLPFLPISLLCHPSLSPFLLYHSLFLLFPFFLFPCTSLLLNNHHL